MPMLLVSASDWVQPSTFATGLALEVAIRSSDEPVLDKFDFAVELLV